MHRVRRSATARIRYSGLGSFFTCGKGGGGTERDRGNTLHNVLINDLRAYLLQLNIRDAMGPLALGTVMVLLTNKRPAGVPSQRTSIIYKITPSSVSLEDR